MLNWQRYQLSEGMENHKRIFMGVHNGGANYTSMKESLTQIEICKRLSNVIGVRSELEPAGLYTV